MSPVRSWFCLCSLIGLIGALVMAEPELAQRIEALRAEIARHDELYFQQAAPEISDYEYDLLKRELRRLEAEAGAARPGETGIGDDRAAGTSSAAPAGIVHGQPMLSLDKAYSEAEVAEFWARVDAAAEPAERPVEFVIEPKFDGVAVSVVLGPGGKLVRAATRGDGTTGRDVTPHVARLRDWAGDEAGATQAADWPAEIELRGEVVLSRAEFGRLNREREAAGEAPWRHPRSVAAGALLREDPTGVEALGLSLVFHGWGAATASAATTAPASVTAFQDWLVAVGLPGVTSGRRVTAGDAATLNAAIETMAQEATDGAFPTDGLVIKVNDLALQRRLGEGPTAPRWALARKFAPPRAQTVLRRIVWQVGRTGGLTPVAEFDPVVVAGAMISRASLHHASEIVRRDLRIGDTVWIEKAGEIIPQVAGVDLALRPAEAPRYELPESCPICATALVSIEAGKALACPQFACAGQVQQRLLTFADSRALGIRGLGSGLAESLVATGLVRSPADLYGLTEAMLVALPGIGPKRAARLLTVIEASRAVELERWLIGIGLPGVGPAGARRLAESLTGLDDLLDPARAEVVLAALGPATAAEVRAALADPVWQELLRRLEAERRPVTR